MNTTASDHLWMLASGPNFVRLQIAHAVPGVYAAFPGTLGSAICGARYPEGGCWTYLPETMKEVNFCEKCMVELNKLDAIEERAASAGKPMDTETHHTFMLAWHEETGQGKRAHAIEGKFAANVLGKSAVCGAQHPGGGAWVAVPALATDIVYCERCTERLNDLVLEASDTRIAEAADGQEVGKHLPALILSARNCDTVRVWPGGRGVSLRGLVADDITLTWITFREMQLRKVLIEIPVDGVWRVRSGRITTYREIEHKPLERYSTVDLDFRWSE